MVVLLAIQVMLLGVAIMSISTTGHGEQGSVELYRLGQLEATVTALVAEHKWLLYLLISNLVAVITTLVNQIRYRSRNTPERPL